MIFVALAGLDQLVSVSDIWRSLAMDRTVHATWWRVPADEVPRSVGHEAQVSWLHDWWQHIDTWITRHHPGDPGSSQRIGRRHTGEAARFGPLL